MLVTRLLELERHDGDDHSINEQVCGNTWFTMKVIRSKKRFKPNVPSHTTNVTNPYDDLHLQPKGLIKSSLRGRSEGLSTGLEVLGGCMGDHWICYFRSQFYTRDFLSFKF